MSSRQVGTVTVEAAIRVVTFGPAQTDILKTFVDIYTFAIWPWGVAVVAFTLEAARSIDTFSLATQVADNVTLGHVNARKAHVSGAESRSAITDRAGCFVFVALAKLATNFGKLETVVDGFNQVWVVWVRVVAVSFVTGTKSCELGGALLGTAATLAPFAPCPTGNRAATRLTGV